MIKLYTNLKLLYFTLLTFQLEWKKLEMLMPHPELSDTVMKHTAITYEHTEKMTQLLSHSKQNEDDEDDTDDDDANQGDQLALAN